MQRLFRISDFIDNVSEQVGKAVSWMCLAMIFVLMYEIFSRYIFMSPTTWAHESTTMLYGSYCIVAGVYTHKHQAHVRSEVFYHLFSLRGRAILDVITSTIGLFIFAVFFVIAIQYAADSWAMNERSSKSTWAPIIYPFKSVLPLAIGLIMLQSVANLIRDILTICRPELSQHKVADVEIPHTVSETTPQKELKQ